MTKQEIEEQARALEERIAGRPYSATSINGRGWLTVEIVIPGWDGMPAGRIFWEQFKCLWRTWASSLGEAEKGGNL